MIKKIILPLVVMTFISFGCNDDIITEGNPIGLSIENSFNSTAEAETALFAAYSGLQANEFYGREFWWMPDMLSDETQTSGPPLEARRFALQQYQIDASNAIFLDAWRALYRVIHRANLVVDAIPGKESATLPIEDIQVIVADAKFLRAWCYFQLLTYWGTVPLTLTPVTSTDGIPMVESLDRLYEVILQDLADAEADLPSVTEYRGTTSLGRATRGAAQALAGKVLLYRGDYAAARVELQKVIDSGDYDLAPNFEDNHREENENNIESLWEIQFLLLEGDNNSGWTQNGTGQKFQAMRGQEYSPFDWHNTLPSEELKAAFEDGDPRYSLTFIEFGDMYGPADAQEVFDAGDILQGNAEIETHWRKYGNAYKQLNENLWSGINHRIIRYADVLMMMAEIENEQNGPTALALSLVNQIRTRAGVPDLPTAEYPTSTQQEMFEAIMHERQVEFASEQIRARDVKRWLANGKITQHTSPNYREIHQFMPIPIAEIDNNPALTNADQKPGY